MSRRSRRTRVPNTAAYTALYLWPLLAAVGFRALPLNRAIICSCLAGFLLLPSATAIDMVGLPGLSKHGVVAIGLVATYLCHREVRPVADMPRMSVGIMFLFLASSVMTASANSDPLPIPNLPGLTFHDALGMTFQNILTACVVVIGAKTLGRQEDHRQILLLVGSAMVLYSVPALLEVRISPQLHNWVYGFHPFSFDQQMRGGGFRASVFMSHGLILAMFLVFGAVALLALRRSPQRVFGVRPQTLALYLGVVLFLQKSLGALIIGGFASLALLLRPRRQVALAALVAVVFLSYPVVRGLGAVPVEWINTEVAAYSSERAGSLQTRLHNEEQLLAKANERPWFGWGGWGRGRVFDPVSGADISITDGHWIIVFGYAGWVGYLSQFGLLCFPLFGLFRRRRHVSAETAGLAVILAANLLDMIPNSSITPLTWLVTGALTGALAAPRRVDAALPAMELPLASVTLPATPVPALSTRSFQVNANVASS